MECQERYIFCNTTFIVLPTHRPVGNKPRWADPGSGVGLRPIRAGVRRKMEQEEGGGEDGTRRVHVGRRIQRGGQGHDVSAAKSRPSILRGRFSVQQLQRPVRARVRLCSPNRKLSHQKLVQLYGVCTQRSPLCLIFEYMENGCLSEYLRARKGSLSQDTMLMMCLDVSEGMNYLESSNFLHRDLVQNRRPDESPHPPNENGPGVKQMTADDNVERDWTSIWSVTYKVKVAKFLPNIFVSLFCF